MSKWSIKPETGNKLLRLGRLPVRHQHGPECRAGLLHVPGRRRKRGLVEVMKSKLPYPQLLSVLWGRDEGREGQDRDGNFWQKTINHIQPYLTTLPTRFLIK